MFGGHHCMCVCAAIIIICPSHAACHHLSHNFVPADAAAAAAICLNIFAESLHGRFFALDGYMVEILWLQQRGQNQL
jgi:hypothetical protein